VTDTEPTDAPPQRGLYTPAVGPAEWRGPLEGHALQAGGEPYLAIDCYHGRCATNVGGTVHQENGAADSVRGIGHGLCECGATSPHMPTGRLRRQWHREHKARVYLGQPEPEDFTRG
jgi:hypothetical protein